MLATDDAAVVDAYRGFGWALGMAFQLNDDLLGIWGDEQSTGKEPSDLAKHKKTLPLIYALEHAAPADRDRLRELLATAELSDAEQAEARAILERTGAREYARARGAPAARRGAARSSRRPASSAARRSSGCA